MASPPFPLIELPLIDITLRMFTEPRLEGDRALLREIHSTEILNKNERLYNLGVGEKELASADKFAALLEAEGIAVDMKPGKLKDIPALAKTDRFMMELLDHEDPRISQIAQARLEVKSTINETRSARLLQMAERGKLAVYLHYAGAHTRRWAGGDSLNYQNLGRQGDLRRTIKAPAGYLIAAPDQSQGECRILNWFAGQADVVERFRRGDDPYLPMASALYDRAITDPKAPERPFGKEVELACGFGMGPPRLESRMKAKGMGVKPGFSDHAVSTYRRTHRNVVGLWGDANGELIRLAARERCRPYLWRNLLTINDGRLYHPNGSWLDYRGLKWQDGEWRLYQGRGGWRKMYGAKLVENVVQWLSRIVTAEAMVRFRQMGLPVVGTSHDDVWLLVPDCDLTAATATIISRIMSETPSWAPGLPLAAECKIGQTYGG